MQTTELLTYAGYPHLLTFNQGVITMVSTTKVKEGDLFGFDSHRTKKDDKQVWVYKVEEVLEERKALGIYNDKECLFYRLKCEKIQHDVWKDGIRYSTAKETQLLTR